MSLCSTSWMHLPTKLRLAANLIHILQDFRSLLNVQVLSMQHMDMYCPYAAGLLCSNFEPLGIETHLVKHQAATLLS